MWALLKRVTGFFTREQAWHFLEIDSWNKCLDFLWSMSETCDEFSVPQAVQEVKHLGGSSAVEMWNSFLVTTCS